MPDDIVNSNAEPNDTVVTETTNNTDTKFFTAEDITKARTEEKSKLYPQIEKLKSEVVRLTEKLNSALQSGSDKEDAVKEKDATIASLEEKLSKLEAKGEENKVSEKLVKELQTKLDEALKALEEKDAEVSQIKISAYKAEKIKELDESVVDLVTGNTEEEIDASIAKAKAIYEKVSAKYATSKETEQKKEEVDTLPKVNMSTVTTTSFGDLNEGDIMGINVSTPEGRKAWKEMKAKFGLK